MLNSTRAWVVALLLVVAATRVAIALAHTDSLIDHGIYQDDAFYYLQIARNAADGNGFSFDESGPTSGFQPLYQWMLVPLVAISGDGPFAPVRASLLLLSVWAIATGAMVFSLGRALAGAGAGLAALAIFAVTPYFLVYSANGQETGLAMFFACAVARAHLWLFEPGATRSRLAMVGYGALGALAVLARLDLAMLLAALVGDALLRARDRAAFMVRLRTLMLTTMAAIVIWLPWSLYSWQSTGDVLPLSGAASREIALNLGWYEMDRVWSDPESPVVFDPKEPPGEFYADVSTKLAAIALMEMPLLSPLRLGVGYNPWTGLTQYPPYQFFLRYPGTLSVVAFAAVAALAALLLRRRKVRGLGLALLIYAALMAVGYGVAIPVHWYFHRYLAPLLLLGSVFGVAAAARGLSEFPQRTRNAAAAIAMVLILAVPIRDLGFFRGLSYAPDTKRSTIRTRFDDAQSQLPPDARLGAFQAGMLSWFAGGGVTNLDGKVNRLAYQALAEGKLDEYVVDSGVTHLLDWEWVFVRMCLRHATPGRLYFERLDSGTHSYEATLYRIATPQ